MDEKKRKLVIDGNAFYEIDLECVRRKQKQREDAEKMQKQRQRK